MPRYGCHAYYHGNVGPLLSCKAAEGAHLVHGSRALNFRLGIEAGVVPRQERHNPDAAHQGWPRVDAQRRAQLLEKAQLPCEQLCK